MQSDLFIDEDPAGGDDEGRRPSCRGSASSPRRAPGLTAMLSPQCPEHSVDYQE